MSAFECGNCGSLLPAGYWHSCPPRRPHLRAFSPLLEAMRALARFLVWVECEAWALWRARGGVLVLAYEPAALWKRRTDALYHAIADGKLRLVWP